MGYIFSMGYYVYGVLLLLPIKCGTFHALLCSYGEMEN